MSCHDIQSQLTDYLDGTLDESNQQRVDAHLAACDECRQYLSDIQATIALTRDLDEVEPPPFFTERIMAQVRQSARPRNWIFQIFLTPVRVPAGVLTAVCLVIVTLSANTWYLQSKKNAQVQMVSKNTPPDITFRDIGSSKPAPVNPELLASSGVTETKKGKQTDFEIRAIVAISDSDISAILKELLAMDGHIDGIVSSAEKYRIFAIINKDKKEHLITYIRQVLPDARIVEDLDGPKKIRVSILILKK